MEPILKIAGSIVVLFFLSMNVNAGTVWIGCYKDITAATAAANAVTGIDCGPVNAAYCSASEWQACGSDVCKRKMCLNQAKTQWISNEAGYTNTGVCPNGTMPTGSGKCMPACPVGASYGAGEICVCSAGKKLVNGQCVEDICGSKKGTIANVYACADAVAVCDVGAVECAAMVVGAENNSLKLKGSSCYGTMLTVSYTGETCTPDLSPIGEQPSPKAPVTDDPDKFCAGGQCIPKKQCGDEDKQICAETPNGGLLCYTQGKCTNTQAPPEPDKPYGADGTCKETRQPLDKSCADQLTKKKPENNNGGSSSSYTAPESIGAPGLQLGGGSGGTGGVGKPDSEKLDSEKFCNDHPDALACATMQKPDDDGKGLEEHKVNVQFSSEKHENGQCPSPIRLNYLGTQIDITYDVICEVAERTRPITLAITSLSAAMILLVGVGGKANKVF